MRYVGAALVLTLLLGCGNDEPVYGNFCVLQTPFSVPLAGKWYASWHGSIYKSGDAKEWTTGVGEPLPTELSDELANLFVRFEWWEYPTDSLPLCMVTYQHGKVYQSTLIERGRSMR